MALRTFQKTLEPVQFYDQNGFFYPCTQQLSIKSSDAETELHTTVKLTDVQVSMS
jgi:hypothetical protein